MNDMYRSLRSPALTPMEASALPALARCREPLPKKKAPAQRQGQGMTHRAKTCTA